MKRLILDSVGYDHAANTPWQKVALRDISLTLDPGERVLIVGGNGSGKSTLTSLMAGLLVPTIGTCTFDGIPINEQAKLVTLVIQHTRLQLMRPTVREELQDLAGDGQPIGAAAQKLGIRSLLGRRIDELSGGQQRRVGLAGALLRSTPLVLLDEPMAGLDHASRDLLVAALNTLPPESIVVAVTHDLEASEPILEQGRRGRLLRINGGRISEGADL